MSWLGKIVGGTIGFAMGGPIGAIAGAALGHGFDKKEDVYLDEGARRSGLSFQEESQLTFFVAAFSMLAKIAKADGRVSEKEIESIDQFMVRDLGLNEDSRNIAVNIFRAAANSNDRFEEFAMQFYGQFQSQPRIIEMMMDVLFKVSAADGTLSDGEERMLVSAAGIFGYSQSEYDRFKSRYFNDVDKFYSILGVDSDATDDEIKKQYRKLVQEYHPDKIAAKGLPEEFTQMATEKFREIQEAYEALKKERSVR